MFVTLIALLAVLVLFAAFLAVFAKLTDPQRVFYIEGDTSGGTDTMLRQIRLTGDAYVEERLLIARG